MGRFAVNTISGTKTYEIVLMYVCSECGRYNQFTHKVVGEGCIFTTADSDSEKIPALLKKACKKIDADLDAKMKEFKNRLKNLDYSELNFKHCCTCCGHTEPWAAKETEEVNRAALVCGTLSGGSILAGVVLLFSNAKGGVLLVALGALVSIWFDLSLQKNKNKRMKKACKELPVSALPKIREYHCREE